MQLGTKEAVGYFASWEDWNPGDNALGNLPSYVTTGAPWRARGSDLSSEPDLLSKLPECTGGAYKLAKSSSRTAPAYAAHHPECSWSHNQTCRTQPALLAGRARVHVFSKSAVCAYTECCLRTELWPACAVVMAFAKPDMTFTPGSFSGTGLQYLDQYYSIVKSNVQTLKLKGVRHASDPLASVPMRKC